MIVVTGSGRGVGTTMVAVNLARVLAAAGRSVAFVDADPVQPEATSQFGLAPTGGIWELFRGSAAVDEHIVQVSPAISVVPGGTRAAYEVIDTRAGRARLIEALRWLSSRFAWTVIDAGASNSGIVSEISQLATIALLVADDRSGPVDTYAAVKKLAGNQANSKASRPIMLFFNRAFNSGDSEATNRSVADTARRFLNIRTRPAGYLYENEDPGIVLAKCVQSLDAAWAVTETEEKDLSIQLAASEGR